MYVCADCARQFDDHKTYAWHTANTHGRRVVRHGRYTTYSNDVCRDCDDCRRAWADYQRDRRGNAA